jgi:hypothetical protein
MDRTEVSAHLREQRNVILREAVLLNVMGGPGPTPPPAPLPPTGATSDSGNWDGGGTWDA